MINTPNHGLKVINAGFEEEDVKETIEGFSTNFKTIDNLIETKVLATSDIPLNKKYALSRMFYNSNPSIGSYAGWINVQEGILANNWAPNNEYRVGDLVKPFSDNGNVYECVISGTSAPTEPSFPTSPISEIQDLNNIQTWMPEKAYKVDDIVIDTIGNTSHFYKCVTAGLSGLQEPSWTLYGDNVTLIDYSVVWLKLRTVKWVQKDTSCNFRPFGKIE